MENTLKFDFNFPKGIGAYEFLKQVPLAIRFNFKDNVAEDFRNNKTLEVNFDVTELNYKISRLSSSDKFEISGGRESFKHKLELLESYHTLGYDINSNEEIKSIFNDITLWYKNNVVDSHIAVKLYRKAAIDLFKEELKSDLREFMGDGFSRSYQNVDSIALIHKNEAFIVDLDKINEQSTIVLEENIVESVDMYSVKRLVDLARQFDFATISNESVYVWSVKEMTADKGRNFLPVVIYNNKKYIIPVFNYISAKDILANKDSSFNKFLDTILNEKL